MTFLPDTSRWSLTQRQLVVTGGALTLLALILGVGGSWFIAGVAERMSDRTLSASARSIADTVAMERGKVTLEMPPAAFGMLEDNARDNVYYVVRQGSTFLTGYRDFPAAPAADIGDDTVVFRYDKFLDQRVRVATIARAFPQVAEPVVIQIAETLDERSALTSTMLIGLALAEASLVGFAVFLIWPAIRWGLRPVMDVRRQISARDPASVDFTPLRTTGVTPELCALIDAFNTLLAQLGAATERSRRFTADASHQMRTPLAVLRAHVEVLQRSATASAPNETIRDIHEATARLQRLLTQLLALSRAEQDSSGAKDAKCSAIAVTRAVCLQMASTADRAGFEIHFDPIADFAVVLTPVLLEEMLTNLIDNSIKYAGGGAITVRVDRDSRYGFIEVADEGPGIPPEFHALVTERFFRIPRDQTKPGSGLGLSIASAIAERADAIVKFYERSTVSAARIKISFKVQEIDD